MAELHINYPYPEQTNSLEIAPIETVAIEDEMVIIEPFKNKNNSLHIIVNASAAGNICFKPGDAYPNAMLGECWVHCEQGYNDIIVEDISRFEDRYGNVSLTKDETLAGEIFAVAKRAGLRPVG